MSTSRSSKRLNPGTVTPMTFQSLPSDYRDTGSKSRRKNSNRRKPHQKSGADFDVESVDEENSSTAVSSSNIQSGDHRDPPLSGSGSQAPLGNPPTTIERIDSPGGSGPSSRTSNPSDGPQSSTGTSSDSLAVIYNGEPNVNPPLIDSHTGAHNPMPERGNDDPPPRPDRGSTSAERNAHQARVNDLQNPDRRNRTSSPHSRHGSSPRGHSERRHGGSSMYNRGDAYRGRSESRDDDATFRRREWSRQRSRSRSREREDFYRERSRSHSRHSHHDSGGSRHYSSRRDRHNRSRSRSRGRPRTTGSTQPSVATAAVVHTAPGPPPVDQRITNSVFKSPPHPSGLSPQPGEGSLFTSGMAALQGRSLFRGDSGLGFNAFSMPAPASATQRRVEEQIQGDALFAAQLALRDIEAQLRVCNTEAERLRLIAVSATLSENIKSLQKVGTTHTGAVKRTPIAYPVDQKLQMDCSDLPAMWKWMAKVKQVNRHNGWTSEENQRHGIRESLSESAANELLQYEDNNNVELTAKKCFEFFFTKFYRRQGTPDMLKIMSGVRKTAQVSYTEYKQNLIFTADMCGFEPHMLTDRFAAGLSEADRLLLQQNGECAIRPGDLPHAVLDRWCSYLEMVASAQGGGKSLSSSSTTVNSVGTENSPSATAEALRLERMFAGVVNSLTAAVSSIPDALSQALGSRAVADEQQTGGINSLGQGMQSGCYGCGEQGHIRRDCPKKQRQTVPTPGGGSQQRRGDTCRHCGSAEHYARGCKRKGRNPTHAQQDVTPMGDSKAGNGGMTSPAGAPSGICTRCNRGKHLSSACFAVRHLNGTLLDPATAVPRPTNFQEGDP